ncbi:MAG: ParB/RepB/Spo0J family partition protein [Zetaproteobacteria bacterium]|nr:ParB/RepB/Spo0J family partition protein [Zetaproteobacteria bacterium]
MQTEESYSQPNPLGVEKQLVERAGASAWEASKKHNVGRFSHVPVEAICLNPNQPRKVFSDKALQELSTSVAENGILQPLIVREMHPEDGKGPHLLLIAGERRLRAAKLAGLPRVPVSYVDHLEDKDLTLGIIENTQREQLNPIEEAKAYLQLIRKHQLSQAECAHLVGKDRTYITNLLRVLELPLTVQEDLCSGVVSMGHAKVLAGLVSQDQQEQLRQEIVKKDLSVRATEKLAKRWKQEVSPSRPEGGSALEETSSFDLEYIAENLRQNLRTKVKLKGGVEKGTIEITYFSVAELERIYGILAADSTSQ